MTEKSENQTPADPKAMRKGFKTIALMVLAFDAVGVFVLMLVNYMLGYNTIDSFIFQDTRRTGLFNSLVSSCSLMSALNIIICIIISLSRGKSNNK